MLAGSAISRNFAICLVEYRLIKVLREPIHLEPDVVAHEFEQPPPGMISSASVPTSRLIGHGVSDSPSHCISIKASLWVSCIKDIKE